MLETLPIAPANSGTAAAKRLLLERLLRGEGESAKTTAIPRRSDSGPAPLSFSQARLWFLDQMTPGSAFYNVPVAVPLPALISPRVLGRSLQEIVRRHESLRITVGMQDGRPVAVPAAEVTIPLQRVSLCHLPRGRRAAEARAVAAEEAQRPFDLAVGPFLRTTLLDLGEEGWLLLVTLHHIVSDGWSVAVFFRELTAIYTAFAAGRPSPLPPLPIQYSDFAAWQRQSLRDEALEKQLAYWRAQLHDLPTLDLQADRPRPAVLTYRGRHHPIAIPAALTDALRRLGAAEGATLFMTMLAAFDCLLYRYTGQEDIVVGVPVAGRNHPETEPLIGFFVNQLVLRTPLRGTDTFHDVLRRVRVIALAAYAHQDVPFDMLVERLQPERDLTRNPLFQVTFQIANTPGASTSAGDGDGVNLTEQGTAIFDLAVNMVEMPAGLGGQIEYSTDLFDAATIERLVAHFTRLLEAIARDPAMPVSRLSMLEDDERRRLVEEWNATDAIVPYPNVVEWFEAQAHATPDAAAVIAGDDTVSYAALNDRANQIAYSLLARGIGGASIVGLRLERSIEMVAALLGIVKAGAAWLPLDPAYPAERLDYMVESSRCALVLDAEQLLAADLAAQPMHDSGRAIDPADLAYVIYTSGSLGRPKAVMIPHSALANHMAWMQERFPLTRSDVVLQRTPLSFDASVWELFAPLLAGATLVLAPADANLDPALLAATVIRHGVTTMQLVPSLLQVFADTSDFAACTSLRRLFCGGEPLHADAVERVLDALDVEVINLYGPTEATIDATYHVCGRGGGHDAPIGLPVANTRTYILDANGELVPVGVAGELFIGGAGLARGYLHDRGLTAGRFVPDPFHAGERLYRTGDRVRRRADGILEFLGRLDQQIKLRGFRIEPGEIEAVLRRHEAVTDTVVVLSDGPAGTRRLVAYVAAAAGTTAAELRAALETAVPEYMVPSAFVIMDALPLTPNGKVDRRALPPPDSARSASDARFVAPATDAERILAKIWASVLGLKDVSVNDNFFELGGDSILSIQIVARAREAGLQLAPQQIFQHQTIAKLAGATTTQRLIDAEQGLVTGPVPLSPIQQWFFEHDSPDLHHFNQAVMVPLPWRVPPETMRVAVQSILAHHDALRTRFSSDGRQTVAEPGEEVPFEHIELDDASGIESVATRVQASLDLVNGPVVRAVLFSLPDGPMLFVVAHHLVIDAVSWTFLLSDILSACEQLRRGDPVTLPVKTTSFQRWAERCTAYAAGAAVAAELPLWLEMASAAAPLPVDTQDAQNTVASSEVVTVSLSAELTDPLLHSGTDRAHVGDALLAALAQTLAAWMGRAKNVIDLEGHGREPLFDDVDVSRTAGWFTTICPLQLEAADGDRSFDLLHRVADRLAHVPHHGIGFGLLRYLSPDAQIRDALRALPERQISFNYLGQLGAGARESTGPWASPRRHRPYLIEINAAVEGGCLRIYWGFSTAVYHRETIERLAGDFSDRLRSIAEHCRSFGVAEPAPHFARARLTENQLANLLSRIDNAKAD